MAVARPSTATVAKRTCFIVYLLIISGCAGGNVSKGRSIFGKLGVWRFCDQHIVWVSSIGRRDALDIKKQRAAPHGTAPCMVSAAGGRTLLSEATPCGRIIAILPLVSYGGRKPTAKPQ